MFQSIITGLAMLGAAHAAVHSIDVGDGGIKFTPNSLTAAVGDQLEFHFYSGTGGHSVVSSTLEHPCTPAANAFFSGYIQGSSSGVTTFVTNVTSTDPIWFYCSLASHCAAGMVGVVNPPAGKSVADYVNAAKGAQASAPASLQGGAITTISESEGGTSTSGAAGATGTSASSGASAATTTPASSKSAGNASSVATSTGSAASTAATTKASAAGRSGELSVVLGLGIFAAGLVALMA